MTTILRDPICGKPITPADLAQQLALIRRYIELAPDEMLEEIWTEMLYQKKQQYARLFGIRQAMKGA